MTDHREDPDTATEVNGSTAASTDELAVREGEHDPMTELDTDVETGADLGGDRDVDPFDELEGTEGDDLATDAFEAVAFEAVDADDLWAAIESGGGADIGAKLDPDAAATPEHELDKREYCQRCPYFAAPPDTACEHADGEILEVLDRDQFRVRGCPMVADGGPLFDRHR